MDAHAADIPTRWTQAAKLHTKRHFYPYLTAMNWERWSITTNIFCIAQVKAITFFQCIKILVSLWAAASPHLSVHAGSVDCLPLLWNAASEATTHFQHSYLAWASAPCRWAPWFDVPGEKDIALFNFYVGTMWFLVQSQRTILPVFQILGERRKESMTDKSHLW